MCTETIAKIILIVLNVVFFIGGGAIMAVGIIAYVKEDLLYKITELLTDKVGVIFDDLKILTELDLYNLIKSNAIILIAVGAFLFILGFLGCCGAMRKSACMLNLYATLVIIILAMEVGLGVYAYMFSEKIEGQIQDGLQLALHKTYVKGARFDANNNIEISDKAEEIAWDAIQLEAACCGVTDHADWATAAKWNKTYTLSGATFQAVLPPSCCARTTEGKAKTDFTQLVLADFTDLSGCMKTAVTDSFNDVACYQRLRDIVFDNKKLIISVFIIVLLVEILAISCACWLKHKSEKNK